MRCWPRCPASSPPRWRSPPPPNCVAHAMRLRAITRRCGEPTTATSAPRSGWRGSVCTPETGQVRSAALDQVPTDSAHFTPAAATAIEILLDGRTPENLDEQTLLDAGKRAAALNLESATKRATIRLRVLGAALGWLQAGHKATSAARLLGCGLRRTRHPDRDGTQLPRAGARDDRTCGSASRWWRRQMRFGRGRGYDRSGGHLFAVRSGRSTRRPVLRELRRLVVGGPPSRHTADPDRRTGRAVRRLRQRGPRLTSTAPSAATGAPSPIATRRISAGSC